MQKQASLTSRSARTLAGASFLLVGFAIANWPSQAHAQTFPSTDTRAVPTYEAAGMYWSNSGANAATGCEVKFRKSGDSAWTQGLTMWLDARDGECRGSLVGLAPGTTYEAQFNLPGLAVTRATTFKTWANELPVAKVIKVASGAATLNITEGGSATGYVVYEGSGATLDAANASAYNVSINASYVIVRGFTLKGAQQDAIRIAAALHDVVIEDNDISGWGRTRDGRWGTDMDSAVRAVCRSEELTRVTIQRNRMHDPRYSANSWTDGHPAGPQGITFSYCGGNHVIRHNDIIGGAKRFNDAMGGEDNFSRTGFPNADSDIYGNRISGAWDDGIEAEGGNRNVRIWGNFLDRVAIGIATTVVSVGPVYIFRNVFSRNEFFENRAHDLDERQPFFKSGSDASLGNGRRYLIHNTMLQPTEAGSSYGLGGGAAVGGTGDAQLVHNTISMNNIFHIWKPNSAVYQVGTDNTFQNDMFNGSMGTAVVNGINATPTYAAGNGWQSEANGQYALAAGTRGHDQGMRIANFNDAFLGAAPDVGAAEAGAAAMKFGVAASSAAAGTGTGTGTGPVPSPTPILLVPPAPAPTPGATGTLDVSTTIDSSSYSAAAGQSVTFTVIVMGNSGTPTGTIAFRDNGTVIAACAAAPISGGRATCSTAALAPGSHSMTGIYSGNATYGTGQAGPITQTITGVAAAVQAPQAPQAASINVQGLWWRGDAESGWGVNLTHQGDTVFATWFTYDTDGSGMWLVMPNGAKSGTNAYSGTLYRTTGPAFSAATFDPSQVMSTPVGVATFSFSDGSNGTFTASVNGTNVSKPIKRQVYGSSVPVCTAGGAAGSSTNYQDLWWRPAGTEAGWGMNITHQGDILFVTWFTYDANGKGLWLVASNVAKTGNGTYSGTLYRTTGPAFNAATFDPARVTVRSVGSINFSFGDAANATFTATVDGVSVTKPLTREVFASPASVCG